MNQRVVNILYRVGPAWFAIVLLTVAGSAFLDGPRGVIAGFGFFAYLGTFLVALAPGALMLYLAERGNRAS